MAGDVRALDEKEEALEGRGTQTRRDERSRLDVTGAGTRRRQEASGLEPLLAAVFVLDGSLLAHEAPGGSLSRRASSTAHLMIWHFHYAGINIH